LWTEEGWLTSGTQQEFYWKKRSVRKLGMVGEKYKGEENSLSLPSVDESQAGMVVASPYSFIA
jgi:hypothetical protein